MAETVTSILKLSPTHFVTNINVAGFWYNCDRNEALHHCTLLVNADIEILNKVLKSKDPRIETAATRSLRVDVKCLSDIGISDPTHMDKVRDLKTARIREVQGHKDGQ